MKTEKKSDNCLIAEFMGIKEQQGFYDSYGRDEPFWFTSNELYRTESRSLPDLSMEQFKEEAKYHSSWDWLMPVVEKIENDLLFQVEIHTAYTNINGEFNDKKYNQDSPFEFQYDTKLSVTYRAVVRFLKWFQEQSNNL